MAGVGGARGVDLVGVQGAFVVDGAGWVGASRGLFHRVSGHWIQDLSVTYGLHSRVALDVDVECGT